MGLCPEGGARAQCPGRLVPPFPRSPRAPALWARPGRSWGHGGGHGPAPNGGPGASRACQRRKAPGEAVMGRSGSQSWGLRDGVRVKGGVARGVSGFGWCQNEDWVEKQKLSGTQWRRRGWGSPPRAGRGLGSERGSGLGGWSPRGAGASGMGSASDLPFPLQREAPLPISPGALIQLVLLWAPRARPHPPAPPHPPTAPPITRPEFHPRLGLPSLPHQQLKGASPSRPQRWHQPPPDMASNRSLPSCWADPPFPQGLKLPWPPALPPQRVPAPRL